MDIERFIVTLAETGRTFRSAATEAPADAMTGPGDILAERILTERLANPWFIPEFVKHALVAWADALKEEKIRRWLAGYRNLTVKGRVRRKVGLVMAGNLPMVGLHDLLCVLASGHDAVVKLSSDDSRLIPAVAGVLFDLDPSLRQRITFCETVLKGFDAVIATGSNNTSRYFDYYFSRYPSLIRRNRNGAALLTGDESGSWLTKLADDIFLYFGLGCRNVSKLYLPRGCDPSFVLPFFSGYGFLIHHHKYCNNYDYQKSLMLINRSDFLDNGFVLLHSSPAIASPVSVIHYEFYDDMDQAKAVLQDHSSEIQCVVAEQGTVPGAIGPGTSQNPELWDYADGTDTMSFLLSL